MPNYTVQFSWYLDVDISANNEAEAIEQAKQCLPRRICMGAPDEIECIEVEDEEEIK